MSATVVSDPVLSDRVPSDRVPSDTDPAAASRATGGLAEPRVAGAPGLRPRRVRSLGPGGGSGRLTGPRLRPPGAVSPPRPRASATRARLLRFRACRADAVRPAMPLPAASGWRLTDRGIAVVMLAGVMIMVAALVVIGLTAVQVTSDSYIPYGAELVNR